MTYIEWPMQPVQLPNLWQQPSVLEAHPSSLVGRTGTWIEQKKSFIKSIHSLLQPFSIHKCNAFKAKIIIHFQDFIYTSCFERLQDFYELSYSDSITKSFNENRSTKVFPIVIPYLKLESISKHFNRKTFRNSSAEIRGRVTSMRQLLNHLMGTSQISLRLKCHVRHWRHISSVIFVVNRLVIRILLLLKHRWLIAYIPVTAGDSRAKNKQNVLEGASVIIRWISTSRDLWNLSGHSFPIESVNFSNFLLKAVGCNLKVIVNLFLSQVLRSFRASAYPY